MNLWHLADKLLERSPEERAEVTIQIDERQGETRVGARIRLSWRDEQMPHNIGMARLGKALLNDDGTISAVQLDTKSSYGYVRRLEEAAYELNIRSFV